jgi:hypothetical protein
VCDESSITTLAECIAEQSYQGNQDSANSAGVSQYIGDALSTSRICWKIVDNAQCQGESGQERKKHLVRGLNNPLISLAAANIHEQHQDDKNNTCDDHDNVRQTKTWTHEMSLIVHPGKCCGLACLYADFSVSSFGAVK